MNKKFAALQLQQMDASLAKIRECDPPSKPINGWAKTIRETLGMTASALARKLHVTPHAISKLEKAEAEEKITVASLRKMANALGCELHYVFVPQKSLEETLMEQALIVAKERLNPISHSMALEDQSVKQSENQLQLLAKEILEGPRRNLW